MPRCCVDVLNSTPANWQVVIDSVVVDFTFKSGNRDRQSSGADVGAGGHARVCTEARHSGECVKRAATSVTFKDSKGRRKTVSITNNASPNKCMTNIPLQPTISRPNMGLVPFSEVQSGELPAAPSESLDEVEGLMLETIAEDPE